MAEWNDTPSPMDVLRDSTERGLAILNDPRYDDAALKADQRDELCDLLDGTFDARLFSKLALSSNWERFTVEEQSDFVNAFASRLCTHYLSILQERYNDETVTFVRQELRNDSLALVTVEINNHKTRVPITVRMAFREGGWIAFDAVVVGVSSLLLYRADLNATLNSELPADLIQGLRASTRGPD